MPSSIDTASACSTQNPNACQKPTIELYFGIFFDGTNNNKLQVILGKRYRRAEYLKEILDKANNFEFSYEQVIFLLKQDILYSFTVEYYSFVPTVSGYAPLVLDKRTVYDKTNISFLSESEYNQLKKTRSAVKKGGFISKSNGNCLVRKGKSIWEHGIGKGILSQSHLDQLFFGYEDYSDDQYFIEKRISNQLGKDSNGESSINNIGWDRGEKTEHFTFASEKTEINEGIKQEVDSFIKEDDEIVKNRFDSSAQSPTYTNVVILESLYDPSIPFREDNVDRKFYSLYVEGSGSDMIFNPMVLNTIHLIGSGVYGLAKGTGDSGTVAKVMKIARQIETIVKGFPNRTKKIYFDIFGFSRGATEARMLNYLLNPKKDNEITEKLSNKNKQGINDNQLFTGLDKKYLKEDSIQEMKVRFLGLYDTVSSIGVLREGWITSNIKTGIIDFIGRTGSLFDNIVNKIPSIFGRAADKATALLLRLLYEKTIRHPEQMASTLLTGLSPDFFIIHHDWGTEEILDFILKKFPFEEYPEQEWVKDVIKQLRYGIESIRVNYVEKYEKYVEDKHLKLHCMKEPDVSAFGKSKYHDENVRDYGLYATKQAEEVFHICAMDEVRSNFALVDIEDSLRSNGLELFLPGCHTDIGGGACLGRDDQKIANISAHTGTPNFLCKTKPFDKKNMELVPMSTDGLMLAGWIDTCDTKAKGSYFRDIPTKEELATEGTVFTDNSNRWIFTPNIIMNRYVRPGYSNIGLNLMQMRANRDKTRMMFKDIPKAYLVPKDLNNYYNSIQETISQEKKGRFFVNPSSGFYWKLRHEWIHFSANEQICSLKDNFLVNSPSFVGAFLNDRESIQADNYIILKGSDINFKKQEHPFMKMGANYLKLIKDQSSFLLPLPLSLNKPLKLLEQTDAMVASRIIYKGTLDNDSTKQTFLFDYVQGNLLGGKFINVSLKDGNDNSKLEFLISKLKKEKERQLHFVTMCQDAQKALEHLKDEQMFFIEKNAYKLMLNQIPIKTETVQKMQTAATFLLLSDGMAVSNWYDVLKFSEKILSLYNHKETSFGDISEKFLDAYLEEKRKKNDFGTEVSNWFIDGYTEARDFLTSVIPEKFGGYIGGKISNKINVRANAKNIAVWFLVNAPEVGKIFGHAAGLIHDYRRISDWKKQEEYGNLKIRVIDKQIEMIKNDKNS